METKLIEQKLERIERLLQGQKEVMNFNELVEYTGFSKSYLYKLTSRCEIPFYRPQGKHMFFNKKEVDLWLQRNRSKTDSEIEGEVLTQDLLR